METNLIRFEIGKRIKLVQEKSGYDAENFAKKLGYKNFQSFYNITNGRTGVSTEVLLTLASEFSVDLNWLLKGHIQTLATSQTVRGDGNVVVNSGLVNLDDCTKKVQVLEQRIKDLEALLASKEEIISLLKNR